MSEKKTVKVLLLRDCNLGLGGDIAKLSPKDAATYKAHGMVDDHPDAVASVKAKPADKGDSTNNLSEVDAKKTTLAAEISKLNAELEAAEDDKKADILVEIAQKQAELDRL